METIYDKIQNKIQFLTQYSRKTIMLLEIFYLIDKLSRMFHSVT